jgi:hypothetical protein
MHSRIAPETVTPTDLQRAQRVVPLRFRRETEYIRTQIREHEAQIAKWAHALHLLRMELSEPAIGASSD